MHHSFKTSGTCSTKIDFDIENGKLSNVKFENGCNGNLKAIGSLVEGMDCKEVTKRLRGITCGYKETSCGDQLARAIEKAVNEE